MNALIKHLSEKNSTKPNRNDLFDPFQQVFDNFFNEFYNEFSLPTVKSKTGFPRWDVYQTSDKWIVEIAATGCEPENISVEILPVTDHQSFSKMLKVSGRISESYQNKDDCKYFFRELRKSAFERCIYLPNELEGDPEATMKNGILKLSWNLPEKRMDPTKKIEIKKID
jgi:HSP20 family molecular chaperone IbpA